jgi:iron complex transport system substrate-binding protein
VIEADVVVFATRGTIGDRRVQEGADLQHAARGAEHRAIYLDENLSGAVYFMTPLSLTYALDRLTPAARGRGRRPRPQRVVDTA